MMTLYFLDCVRSPTQPATAIPIERAVPATCRLADSMSAVLRSGSLMVAISSTWALVTEPACSRPDVAAPFWLPAAWRRSAGVGGGLGMDVKGRAAGPAAGRGCTVWDAGRLAQERRGRRGLEDEREGPVLVDGDLDRDDRALLVLGRCVVLLAEVHRLDPVRPEGGSDRGRGGGPTGRELDLHDREEALLLLGWHWCFSLPVSAGLQLCDLAEFEFYRGLSTENVDQDLELQLILVDLCDLAGEVRERAFLDPHRLADLVLEAGTAALGRRLPTLPPDLEKSLAPTHRQQRGPGARAYEAGHPRGVPDDGPAVIVQFATAQEVAREHLLLDDHLLAVLELDDVLHGDDHLIDAVFHVHRDGPAVQVGLDLVLIPRVGVHDKPAARLVVGADDERLLVVLVVLVVLVPGVRICLDGDLHLAGSGGVGLGGSGFGLGGRRIGLGGSGHLGLFEALVVADGWVGSVFGHSHTDHVLKSQRTPLAKA